MFIKDLYENEYTPKDIDEFINLIKDEPFIKNTGKGIVNNLMYRGINDKLVPETYTVLKTRSRKKPLDTVPVAHKIVGSKLKEEYGIDLRTDTVFASKNKRTASMYTVKIGDPPVIIPKGEYVLWSSNARDMTVDLGVDEDFFLGNHKILALLGSEKFRNKIKSINENLPEEVLKFFIQGVRKVLSKNLREFASRDTSIENIKNLMYENVLEKVEEKIEEYITQNMPDGFLDFLKEPLMEILNGGHEQLLSDIDEYVSDFKKYKNPADIPTYHEIMVECDEYYIVDYHFALAALNKLVSGV